MEPPRYYQSAIQSVSMSIMGGHVGRAGPVLLEDFQTLEKLATLHRERIPPRIVHAKGAAAKGFFEVCGRQPPQISSEGSCHGKWGEEHPAQHCVS